jgi:signal transduction histidine kinase
MRAVDATTTPGSRLRVLDAAILLLVVFLAISSLAVWADPGVARLAGAGALDLALDVAATVVGTAVAILAWIRWRETNEVVALYQSSAFVALTVINSFTVAVVLLGRQEEFGMSAGQPGEAPIYLWAVTRLMAAFLLVLGAWQSLRRQHPVLPRLAISIGPAIVLAVLGVVLLSAEAALPAFGDARDLVPGGEGVGVASTLVAGLQVLGFVLFAVAAILFRRLYIRDRLPSHAFLAAGLVLAAFSQLHFALDPVVAFGVVPSSEVLRLAFHAILFMGVQAELESELGVVRRTNAELRRLRDVDKAHAVLSERTRLAREIHDGLAQDLWYAKLKQGRLAQDRSLDEHSRADANDVLGAIDSALAEARQRPPPASTSNSGRASTGFRRVPAFARSSSPTVGGRCFRSRQRRRSSASCRRR